ncbi:rod shape-determining protein MreD [Sphingomonas spermidinifaciens]|uniref:Rod shape-determining protein MreD n=1 Tax=Sphingomonas spermidinifaciens TaxID=1141889 RepID=A0A2A4B4J3_9SPHN|nr:rod shape-determining protein MreD [Sphingomonas spermidinifaciens]PCD02967.1 rod shape-determining protein MreD [Sphingomonas spermidinifaciens]
MNEPLRSAFSEPEPPRRSRRLAPVTVMLGSLATLLPVISTVPWMPPFGLMLLLGWRLLRPDVLRVWAGAPLGLFDDLVSGQPIGSAMLLWGLSLIVLDMLDLRLVWRDFWQDWLLASGTIAFCLIGGRLIASPLGSNVDTAVGLQILSSAALYPLVARLCFALDVKGKP